MREGKTTSTAIALSILLLGVTGIAHATTPAALPPGDEAVDETAPPEGETEETSGEPEGAGLEGDETPGAAPQETPTGEEAPPEGEAPETPPEEQETPGDESREPPPEEHGARAAESPEAAPEEGEAAVGEAPESAEPSPGVAAARAWREAHAAEILAEFVEFLRLPNVASDAAGIRANAEHIREAFEQRGAAMEMVEVGDAPPVVFGTLPAQVEGGEVPTLVLYAHYDGQPVQAEKWTHDPWEPTLYTAAMEADGWPRTFPEPGEPVDPEWRLYARAAGDDKAPIQALLAALDALEAAGVKRTVDLKLFFEGEEEAGSPHLGEVVEGLAERLEADAWLFLDGPVHQTGRPQIFFGVRGIAMLEITVYGANRYLHSGHYGNWAPNPSMRLARLLASMKNDEGEVLIDGFYDSVAPLGDAEEAAIEAYPDFEDGLRRELGLAVSEGGNDERYLERILLPSLNVRGMVGASVGPTARNVIPPEATASLDVRLVAGNRPNEMLDLVEAHIREQGYHVLPREPNREERLEHPKIARVIRRGGYPAVRTPMDLPVAEAVIAAAEAAAPEPVVLTPTLGGSLPFYIFDRALGAPLLGLPIANHDDNQHAPDENLRLGNLFYGIDLFASLVTMGGGKAPEGERTEATSEEGPTASSTGTPEALPAAGAEAPEEGDEGEGQPGPR